ncbi:MAG: hypothetical protein CL454_00525 [Acidimicrobiaceae bacterium]|nr:hypothetical protein [Acidimicrobiaceae bacterium]
MGSETGSQVQTRLQRFVVAGWGACVPHWKRWQHGAQVPESGVGVADGPVRKVSQLQGEVFAQRREETNKFGIAVGVFGGASKNGRAQPFRMRERPAERYHVQSVRKHQPDLGLRPDHSRAERAERHRAHVQNVQDAVQDVPPKGVRQQHLLHGVLQQQKEQPADPGQNPARRQRKPRWYFLRRGGGLEHANVAGAIRVAENIRGRQKNTRSNGGGGQGRTRSQTSRSVAKRAAKKQGR